MYLGDVFYTLGAQETMAIVSTGSDPSTTKYNLLDPNLNTAYTMSTAANGQYITVNTGSTHVIHGFGLWIKNYTTNYSTGFMTISGSANGSSWTGLKVSHINHAGGPLAFTELTSFASYQYYRISLTQLPATAMQISLPFFARKRRMKFSAQYQDYYTRPKPNNAAVELSNFTSVTANSRYPVWEFQRKFKVYGGAEIEEARGIHQDCNGRRNLFLYKEDPNTSVLSTIYVCQMDNDAAAEQRIDASFYNFTMNFTSRPYIRAGDTI